MIGCRHDTLWIEIQIAMAFRTHLQTVAAILPWRSEAQAHDHEELVIPIPEGGELVAVATWQKQRAPAVILLHGVAGHSEDPYVLRAADALVRAGYHAIRLNQRGTGRGKRRAERLYHAGLTEDLALAERALSARDDVDGVLMLGFSLGAAVALRHACERAGEPHALRGVAAVSAPIDLHSTMRHLDTSQRTVVRVYERAMLKNIVARAKEVLERRGGEVPYTSSALERITSISDFDRTVTVPTHGFRDADDYYTKVSVGPLLERLDVPTLFVHADDDPIVPVAPLREVRASSRVEVVITRGGGHVGFIDSFSQLSRASSAVQRAIAHFLRHAPPVPT
jgi:uncharacterized protein